MKRMIVSRLGGPEQLHLVEEPTPTPGPGEVLVEVRAAGVNWFDTLIIAGEYQVKPEPPFAPGAEVGGVVVAVGEGVTRVAVDDRVMGVLAYGGWSSHVVLAEGAVFRIPEAMSFVQAAAFPTVYQTSYFGLRYRADLQPGETLLVHAAAGGVGLAAVQIGHALGATVYGTAGSEAKCDLARAHGADEAFNYRQVDWLAAVKEATGGRGADVIYDPVGGDIFHGSTKCVAFAGRILVIGFASGRIPQVRLNRVLLKNIAIVGLHWGAYREHDPAKVDQAMAALFELFERGAVPPLISSARPLAEAAEALAALKARKTVGKLVLTV